MSKIARAVREDIPGLFNNSPGSTSVGHSFLKTLDSLKKNYDLY